MPRLLAAWVLAQFTSHLDTINRGFRPRLSRSHFPNTLHFNSIIIESKMPTKPLNYAPAPPRSRRWIKRASLLLITASMGWSAYQYGPTFWHRIQRQYWQRQCMNFTLPPDTVVYEEEPTAATKLIANQPKSYVNTIIWTQIRSRVFPAASHICTCLKRFSDLSYIGHSTSLQPTFFMHERVSASGHHRLILIDCGHPVHRSRPIATITGWEGNRSALTPICLTDRFVTESLEEFSLPPEDVRISHSPQLRVYAGQPDLIDAAHFTIRYQMWGQEDILDGRLNDDDTVTLKPRKPPVEPKN